MKAQFLGSRSVGILSVGHAVPEERLTNAKIAEFVDTNDEWIRSRTGIESRRRVASSDSNVDLGGRAVSVALERAGITPSQIGLLVAATISADQHIPGLATGLCRSLNLEQAVPMDVSIACSGFTYALPLAAQWIASGVVDYAIVVGSEVMSRLMDWTDRSTCVLFGDAAGAVVLGPVEPEAGIRSFVLGTDGAGGENLTLDGGLSREPFTQSQERSNHVIRMNGRGVYKFAVQAFQEVPVATAEAAGWTMQDIDLFIPHQANQRIIDGALKRLGLSSEKVVMNIAEYGNTVSASVPLALSEAWETGRIKSGDNLVLMGFGGGLSWGGVALTWSNRVGSP